MLLEKPKAEQLVLIFDPERCTGCRYCEIACSFQHYGTLTPERSHIRIYDNLQRMELEASDCQHCEEPACAAACPEDAIKKDEAKEWVTINPMKCTGCRSCIFACPLSCIWFDKEHHVAAKCDFCDGDPVCVKYCSPQAIKVGTRAEALEFTRQRYGREKSV